MASQGLKENGGSAVCLSDSRVDALSPVDRRNSLPLFVQLTSELRERLNREMCSGKLKAGDFFTTEKFLCRKYGVSTITAKRALDELESEGLVVRHRGRGTFVARSLVIQNLDHFYRFTTAMKAQGFQPTWKNLRIDTANPDLNVRRLLGLSDAESVVRIERLRLLNGEPFFLHTSYLPKSLFPDLEQKDHENVALYDLLAQNYHVAPVRCQDTFEPVLLKKRAANLLQVPPRSAGMLLRRVAFTAEGVPVELSRGVIRGDRCRLTVDLR